MGGEGEPLEGLSDGIHERHLGSNRYLPGTQPRLVCWEMGNSRTVVIVVPGFQKIMGEMRYHFLLF